MELVFWFTVFFFLCSTTFSALSWIRIWEEEGYRFGRILALHFLEIGSLVRWFVFFLYLATIFLINVDIYYHILVFILYSFFFIKTVENKDKLRYTLLSIPRRDLFILISLFVFQLLLLFFPPADKFLWLLFIDRILPFVFVGLLILFSMFWDFGEDIAINKAVRKISYDKNIFIVGIFGERSTAVKNYLSFILSVKFNVLKTSRAPRNLFSIAETIDKEMKGKKQIFISEIPMSPARRAEEIASFITPEMLIFQNVPRDNRLIALSEKYGVVLFNNNKKLSRFYKNIHKKKFLYSSNPKDEYADIVLISLKETKSFISFRIKLLGKEYQFEKVKGLRGNDVQDILPAIFVASYLGIDFPVIKRTIESYS